jgi:hypothetical protein
MTKIISATNPAEIGAPYEGGFYAGQIAIDGHPFAIAVAPKAVGEVREVWLPSYDMVPGAASCFDSVANTIALAEAGSPLAKAVMALNIDDKTDWVIPARDVLEVMYRNLKPTAGENHSSFRDGDNPSSIPVGYPYTEEMPAQTGVPAFQKGGAEAFEAEWYWSSTQFSQGSAWAQTFSYGYQDTLGKSGSFRCRAVRLIQL